MEGCGAEGCGAEGCRAEGCGQRRSGAAAADEPACALTRWQFLLQAATGAATPGTALKEELRRLHPPPLLLLLLMMMMMTMTMMMMMRRRLGGGEEGPRQMKRQPHAGQDRLWQLLARRRRAGAGQVRTAPRRGELWWSGCPL